MRDKELAELMEDDFLDSLDDGDAQAKVEEPVKPDGLPSNKEHLVYRGWKAILALRAEKEKAIKAYKKIADKKTPKGLYEMKKTEVGRAVGKDQRYIFYGNGEAYEGICKFFDKQNEELLEIFEKAQKALTRTQKVTGIRVQKKEQIVSGYQRLRDENEFLRRQNAKDMLDLSIRRLPLELQVLLKSTRKKG
jgi:hypothetical protein